MTPYNTFDEYRKLPPGTTICFEQYGEYRIMVRTGAMSLCAYIGVPSKHPCGDKNIEDLCCHGGVTFSSEGDGTTWPLGFWWYGWDYSHAFDAMFYPDEVWAMMEEFHEFHRGDRKWTVEEVLEEARGACEQLNRMERKRG